MTSKHTPGPWHVETIETADTVEAIAVRDGNYGMFLAQIEPHAIEHADALANARLIAAAPELLAALEALVAVQYSGNPEPAFAQARAAIAKVQS